MSPPSPLQSLHEKTGTTLADYFGCLLPQSFTDWREEYRRAKEAVALADTNFHSYFYFLGPDRARYLNAMLTNNVKDLAPGDGNISLLLNPQGHILAEVETSALPDRFLARSHAINRARTAETFEKYIIMDDVTLEDVTDHLGSLALIGPRTESVLRSLGGPGVGAFADFAHVQARLSGVDCRVVRTSRLGAASVELIAEHTELPTLWEALLDEVGKNGGGTVGYVALNSLRLEAGIPWFGYDFDEKQIPHEAALENTHINFTKGCYTGQEIVERVRSRGQVHRRRASLKFPGDSLPQNGEKLFVGEAEAGFVTSAAASPMLGAGIGMGYLRREHASPGARLRWSHGTAHVIEFPASEQTSTAAH